jgi:hypothetical protein
MHGALLRPTEAPERPVLWVVSRSSTSVGPNATLVNPGVEGAIGRLKAERDGEWEVARPSLAGSLTELGLIDEYRISCTRSCSVTASFSSWDLCRRSASWPTTSSTRT